MIPTLDAHRLRDMAIYARHAIELLGDKSAADLETDLRSRFAVIHCVEIVGEAAAKVSVAGRDQVSGLTWPRIVGMRNALIHGYPDIDLSRVVNVVRSELPALIETINAVLGEET